MTRQRPLRTTQRCIVCGKAMSRREGAMYCGAACKQAAYRARLRS